MKVDIKLHSEYATLERHGDLIDLNFCGLERIFRGEVVNTDNGTIVYNKGDIFRVYLGVAMKLPWGRKAQVFARSGTRKNFNIMLTNAVGQIDNNYNGTNDQWLAEFVALDDGAMELGDRILQFEIVRSMPEVEFTFVDKLEDVNRGGFSSTGK